MKKVLLLFACLALSLSAGETLLKIHSIQDLTPVFKVRPPDPENKRIRDGNLKNFSWWSVNIKQNPAAVLDIQLEKTSEVSKIVLYFYAHAFDKGRKGSWQPILVEVYTEGANGADVPLLLTSDLPEINQRYTSYTIPLKNIRSRRFKLRMNANRNLGISEIQFYGKEAAPQAKKTPGQDLFSATAPAGAQLRPLDIDGDGKKRVYS